MRKITILLLLVTLLFGCSQSSPDIYYAKPREEYQVYREHLPNDVKKKAYDAILDAQLKLLDSIYLQGIALSELEEIVQNIKDDHPELYYIDDQYEYVTDSSYEETKTIEYKPLYRMTKETIIDKNKQIEDYTTPIINEACKKETDYEKVKYIYDYLIDHTTYDEKSEDNQNILSVFLNKTTVCAGYAKGMQFLLNKLDIPCAYITGLPLIDNDKMQDAHAINMVELDGHYYYFDATNGDMNTKSTELRYMYFAMSQNQMKEQFRPYTNDIIEESTSEKDSYYHRYDSYFKEANQEQMATLIAKRLNEKGPFRLVYQCMNQDIAKEIAKMLEHDDYLFNMTGKRAFNYYEFKSLNVYAYILDGQPI